MTKDFGVAWTPSIMRKNMKIIEDQSKDPMILNDTSSSWNINENGNSIINIDYSQQIDGGIIYEPQVNMILRHQVIDANKTF